MYKPPELINNGLADMLNDQSIDRIMAIDEQWYIIAWNRTAEEVSGIKKAAVLGKKLLDVFPRYAGDKEMMAAIRLAFSGIKAFVPSHKEFFNRQHYENHFIPLKDEQGHIMGVMNIMHDVAHRIKAEHQLHQLNIALKKKYEQLERANDEMSTITYITSTNIKEPLRHVYSSLELLVRAEGKVLSDGGKANVRRMQASLNRMNLLLDDILALSGIHNPVNEGTTVDLNGLLEEARQQLDEKLKAGDASIEAGQLPAVTGHRHLLYYLFLHLINNALKHRVHAQPLKITIKTSRETFPQGNMEEGHDQPYTRISFIDNGTGFHPEDAERIFLMTDKTPRTYASSGAGLAICRKIMTAHDGFIQAEGWPGKGAAFHCYFPLDIKELLD
jgi:PAS domain S-box-containing protein